jgi:sortase (surface protein transpeptidase)
MIVATLTTTKAEIRPPRPAPAAAPVWPRPAAPPAGGHTPVRPREPIPVTMKRSNPLEISIPRINVNAEVMNLGTNEKGEVQTPPLDRAELAGWYEAGPSPGERGNAVVIGHVDSKTGPAVFFHIGALVQGDVIEVRRTDQSIAKFEVYGVASYPKEEFPTDLVYGDSRQADLRLVTCGGDFDKKASSYKENIVVFAKLSPPPKAAEEANTPPKVPGAPPANPAEPPANPGAPPAMPADPPANPGNPPANPGNPPAMPAEPPANPGNPPANPGNPPANPPAMPAEPPANPGNPPANPGNPPANPADPPAMPAEPPANPGNPPGIPGAPPANPAEPPATPATPPAVPVDPPATPAVHQRHR